MAKSKPSQRLRCYISKQHWFVTAEALDGVCYGRLKTPILRILILRNFHYRRNAQHLLPYEPPPPPYENN